MTQTHPPVTAQLGQAVGEAQRTLARLQSGMLEAAGTDFQTWVTLNTIVTRRPSLNADELPLDVETVRHALATGIGLDDRAIQGLLDRLIADGLIARHGEQLALTHAGNELHAGVRAENAKSTERLIDGLAPEQIELTVRTLRELTARAQTLLTDTADN